MYVENLFALGLALFKIIEPLWIISLIFGITSEPVVSKKDLNLTRSAWEEELGFFEK